MTAGGIIEEESSQNIQSRGVNSAIGTKIPTPKGHSSPPMYNDFLGRQQTQVQHEQAVIQATKLHKVAAQGTMEGSELNRFNNDDSSAPSQSVSVS